jgi:hypothetical protein
MQKIIPIYSKNQVNKAGQILQRIDSTDEDIIWAFDVLENWRGIHSYPINTFQATLRQKLKNIDATSLVAQRLKRTPSIIAKLQRFPQMQLSRMQDIGGLRAVMGSISSVRKLEDSYNNSIFNHKLVGKKDYILDPKDTGYRGIHLIYKYQNPSVSDYNGLHVELQIRTRLQHAWATAVETMGTFLEHALKSSEGPKKWLDFFSLTGSAFAHIEKSHPLAKYSKYSELQTYKLVAKEAEKLKIEESLTAFRIAANHISRDKKTGSYHLIILEPARAFLTIKSFSKNELDNANKEYIEYEKKGEDEKKYQVVLVSTSSIEALRKAYPNYFLDTKEFLKILTRIKKKVSE